MLPVSPTVNILVFFEETPISLRPNVMEVADEKTDDMRITPILISVSQTGVSSK